MKYLNEYGKSYGTKAEYRFRLEQFKKTKKFISEHDEKATGHTVGINHMADFTAEEYKKLLGFKKPKDFKIDESLKKVETSNQSVGIPDSLDWRQTPGAVSAVKNQGYCGSCWAFASTAAMETAYWKNTGTMMTFSEQQLVDCVKDFQNCCYGCNGGMYYHAWAWLATYNQGAASDSTYPYKAYEQTCKRSAQPSNQVPYGLIQPDADNGQALREAVAERPIAVAIQAENDAFRSYTSGIIKSGCGTDMDHAVTVVGYGVDTDLTNYFIVKNSWSSGWGESGYVRIAEDQCGITALPLGVTMAQ